MTFDEITTRAREIAMEMGVTPTDIEWIVYETAKLNNPVITEEGIDGISAEKIAQEAVAYTRLRRS